MKGSIFIQGKWGIKRRDREEVRKNWQGLNSRGNFRRGGVIVSSKMQGHSSFQRLESAVTAIVCYYTYIFNNIKRGILSSLTKLCIYTKQ